MFKQALLFHDNVEMRVQMFCFGFHHLFTLVTCITIHNHLTVTHAITCHMRSAVNTEKFNSHYFNNYLRYRLFLYLTMKDLLSEHQCIRHYNLH